MRFSIAVINPSYFEGWSSTVEEAKSIGKSIILSDINVHVEQDPPDGHYFSPDDSAGLAVILEEMWLNKQGGPDNNLEKDAQCKLPVRIRNFATAYQDCILSFFKEDSNTKNIHLYK